MNLMRDFGLLIIQDNKILIKLFQVSKNKSMDDFKKLDLEIIKLHCINIKRKLIKLNVQFRIFIWINYIKIKF